MKYRRLSNDELEALESDFVKFLVLNGIDAPSWEKLKSDPTSSAQTIEAYSDVVWGTILGKVKYLEQVDSSGIRLYQTSETELFLIGIKPVEGFNIDFTNAELLTTSIKEQPENFQVIRAKKKYTPDRSTEIFAIIDRDKAYVSDGNWYKSLEINVIG
jgi:Family of unknown function (DUF6495)